MKNPHIVLIDDDKDTQTVIKTIMDYNKYPITIFSTAQEALDHLSQIPRPDLVILDLYLPDSDGFQALKRIRQHWPDIPVVATTAYYTDSTPTDIENGGFQGLLTKPYKSGAMIDYLQQILN